MSPMALGPVAAAQLAVDLGIEQRSITREPVLVQPEAHGPDLLWLESPTGPALYSYTTYSSAPVH